MQNKGIIRLFAILLALACIFSLSFSLVTRHYNNKAKAYAAGDSAREYAYLDSISGKKVWLGYTLKECREREINLGLDLKGGMNVTLEVSVNDILRALSGYNTSETFNKAIELANKRQQTSGTDYVSLFVQAYEELDPNARLATVFSTFELKDKINLQSTNSEVESVLRSEVDGAIQNSFNVLRTRIDRFGVVQPNIQKLAEQGRILVELPGVKEPERVRKLLQGTANLEFWETYESSEILPALEQANRVLASMQVAETPAAEAAESEAEAVAEVAEETDGIDELLAKQTADSTAAADNAQAAEEYRKNNPLFAVLIPSVDQTGRAYRGPVVGMAHYSDTAKVTEYLASNAVRELLPRNVKFCWTVKPIDEAETVYQLVALKVTNRDGRAALEGDVITDANADIEQNSVYAQVSMTMNAEGAKSWARITKENVGKSVAISLDGFVYSFPTVQTEISGGRSQITGNFTIEEAKDLANTLKSGKMPAPARIIQEDIVGPSLGQESIHAGLISFVIAFCLVLLYMIFYYGVIPGLIADCALLVNIFFLFGILASFGAVLTLPGIAGIVLTMGMAVDANVLIYERIREELRSGKNQRMAVQGGFANAISAIIDANVTTLLTGVVLAVFGTGPIKGFAVTLIIGIITSFITAVFITRLLLDWYVRKDTAKQLPFTTSFTKSWFQNMHFDFIGKRRIGYIISSCLILISVCSFIFRGFNLGIDFQGGRNYVVRFAEPVSTTEIHDLVAPMFGEDGAQVITIGSNNQVRISTKYKIADNGENVDNEIEQLLYEGLKSKLPADLTLNQFASANDDAVSQQIGIVSSQKVGPTIADDIKTSAVWAIIIALIIIFLYILIRFRNVAFSCGGLAGLAHDTIVVLGMYSLFWGVLPFSMEVDQTFIAAILTIIGYSINDTVVIFDRIRENLKLFPKRDRASVMNDSINTTLSRTFSTSLSTLVVLIAIFFFGGETIRGFVFSLLVGVISGTYSSIFIASPIAYEITKGKKAAITDKK